MMAPQYGKRPCAAPGCPRHATLSDPFCPPCHARLSPDLALTIGRLTEGARAPDPSRRADCARALEAAIREAKRLLAPTRSPSATARRVRLASPYGFVTVRPDEPGYLRRRIRNGTAGEAEPVDASGWTVSFDSMPGEELRVPTRWLVFEGAVRPVTQEAI